MRNYHIAKIIQLLQYHKFMKRFSAKACLDVFFHYPHLSIRPKWYSFFSLVRKMTQTLFFYFCYTNFAYLNLSVALTQNHFLSKMRKIITIGESILDTIYQNQQPVCSFIGGRVSNAAAALGDLGLPVSMVSECCTDKVGDWVVDFFEKHHVDTKSIDRYTDGSTPLAAIFQEDGEPDKIVNYGLYPSNRFNVIWPRIDEDDIVLFGSYYAIDMPQREKLFDLLSYAAERKAIVIYLPGFQHGTQFNITKVMPNILENFEVSSIVIDHDKDINNMFPNQDSDTVYNNHIKFYGPTYVHITPGTSATIYKGVDKTEVPYSCDTVNHLGWQAGFIAGVIHQLIKRDIKQHDIETLNATTWQEITATAFHFAANCAQSPTSCLSQDFAKENSLIQE